jgi:hypothetical protein
VTCPCSLRPTPLPSCPCPRAAEALTESEREQPPWSPSPHCQVAPCPQTASHPHDHDLLLVHHSPFRHRVVVELALTAPRPISLALTLRPLQARLPRLPPQPSLSRLLLLGLSAPGPLPFFDAHHCWESPTPSLSTLPLFDARHCWGSSSLTLSLPVEAAASAATPAHVAPRAHWTVEAAAAV